MARPSAAELRQEEVGATHEGRPARGPPEGRAGGAALEGRGSQLASTAENTHQASSDFAVRLRMMYVFSPNR